MAPTLTSVHMFVVAFCRRTLLTHSLHSTPYHSLLNSSVRRDKWLWVPDVTDIWSCSTVAMETGVPAKGGLTLALTSVIGEVIERQAWRGFHGPSGFIPVFWKQQKMERILVKQNVLVPVTTCAWSVSTDKLSTGFYCFIFSDKGLRSKLQL